MRIAVDISPISKKSKSLHKIRGVGAYINMLVENLPKFDARNEYVFVEDKNFPSDIDLIHYPYFDPFFITLPSKFHTKTIVTVHDLTPLVFPEHFPPGIKGRIKWIIQKSRLKKVDLVIADSECSKKDLERLVGLEESKVKVVYLAVDEKFKKLEIARPERSRGGNWKLEIQKRFSLPESFLLYVGDATWNKNLPRLISAVRQTKYQLVLVGKVWGVRDVGDISDNLWNDDFRKVLLGIANDNQFIRLGFVPDEDLVRIYNLATALIMPSIYEGFGLPILEAMNCGCPVICSRGGSLSEVAGNAVLYVDPKSEESIKEGIERIFSESKLRDELSKKGFEQAKKFSVEKMMRNLINVYEETSG